MSLELLIEQAERILEVHRAGQSGPDTYRKLCEEFPVLGNMKFETFRIYLRVINQFELKYPIANKQTISYKLANHKIAGWNVTPWRGYYRAFRRIGGKLHSLYIGRHLEDAEIKIMAKEAAIQAHGAGRGSIP